MTLVHFPTPSLYKFCPEEFDITKGCNTLRFGTLYDYRTHENEKLRDAGEGKFTFNISFPEITKVSNEWIAALHMDIGGTIDLGYLELNRDGAFVKNINMEGSSHNCWIFCVSRSPDSAGNISETHQSKWEIPGESVHSFASHLESLIWSEVKHTDLPPDILKQYSLQEIQQGLGIVTEFHPVLYANRELTIRSEADLPVAEIPLLRAGIPFTKTPMFKAENEVRFAFFLTFRGKKISIANAPKIVKLRPIDKILQPTY
jgi:hypothetical protein